jgi:Glycosyl transferase family 2
MNNIQSLGSLLPCPSIVIEWENAELAALNRPIRMLSQLSVQLKRLAPRFKEKPEIIFLFHEHMIDAETLKSLIDKATDSWAADVRVIPAPAELKYYSIKNFGARQSSREILLLLDSDVVPEDDWLESLLNSFRDKTVDVVCGETYIEPSGWYARAVGLFWVFDVRTSKTEMETVPRFWANNVAFKRKVFVARPFPEVELFRGQCSMLASALRRSHRNIYLNAGAKVSHPPPNGFYHFFSRALCTGSDYCQRARWRKQASVVHGFRELAEDHRIMSKRISTRSKASSASTVEAIAAYAIGSAFYTAKFVGYLLSLYDNRLVARYFPI